MVPPRERLYGFDVRGSMLVPDVSWSQARRDQFLLQPEVSVPLSVDPRVWRQVLPPGFVDGRADCWRELEALRCAISTLDPSATTPVALTVVDDRDEAQWLQIGCSPSAIDPQWKPLGWDIVDTGMISGLSNCGYNASERHALRAAFGAQLNSFGLFDELANAQAFCAATDERVPEHAPFLVQRMFLVPR